MIYHRFYSTLCVATCFWLVACSSQKQPGNSIIVNHQSNNEIAIKLYREHQKWQGVPYRLGGLTKAGVDCSGLVYQVYKAQFGLLLPRTTEYQAKVGKPISKQALQAGDLVFFKTGDKVRHVGIYIEKGQFFHASTSKGVMISKLNNVYWNDAYWQARRVD